MKHFLRLTSFILITIIILVSCGMKDRKSGNPDGGSKPELTGSVSSIDEMLLETSGLIDHGGRLWTINDSGGEPVLFAMDRQTGKVLQAIRVLNGRNRDWESLAQDDKHIYICDVGNNFGRREELQIYKMSKDSIPASGNAGIHAEIIRYTYAGREKNNPMKRSPYDCEAAIALNDSIYLFTKDWEKRTSTIYACSKTPGKYELQPRQVFPAAGLITGADINPDGTQLVLVGYRDFVPFIWIINDFAPSDYSHGKTFRFEYPEHIDLQTEGIAFSSPGRVYISSERAEFPAALHIMDPRNWVK